MPSQPNQVAISIPNSVMSLGQEAVRIYGESVSKGTSPKMAEMFAARKPAGLQGTDTQWLAGRGMLRKQFDNDDRLMKVIAERHRHDGFDVPENAVYLPTLAQKPNDPRAYVSSQGEAVAYAKELGIGLELDGREVLKAREPEEDPFDNAPALCPVIAHEEAVALQQINPNLGIHEATEMAVEKHGSSDF